MLRSLFAIALISAGFAGALFSRHVGLFVYVWFALFRPVEWVWWDLRPFRLSLVAAVLYIVPSLASGLLPTVSHPLTIGALLFGTVAVVANVQNGLADWGAVDQFFRLMIVSLFAVTLLTTRKQLTTLLAVMAVSIGFFSVKAGMLSYWAGGVHFAAGQAGSFVDSNGYALAIDMVIPFMATVAMTLRFGNSLDSIIKSGFFAAIPFSVFTIIGTRSRGGLLALGVLTLAFAVLHKRRLLVLPIVLVGAWATWSFAPRTAGYDDRIATITTYDEIGEGSALGRLHFWRVATVMAEANPLGVGLGQFNNRYNEYDTLYGTFGTERAVHSSHFQVLSELGYLGLVVWVAQFACAFWLCARVRFAAPKAPGLSDEARHYYGATAVGLATSMVAFVIGGAFISAAANDLTWFTFAAVAAMDRIFQAECQTASVQSAPVPEPAVRTAPVRPRRAAIA